MATVATRPMTADEFVDFTHRPENRDRRWELVNGEVIELPSPGKSHCFVCGRLAQLLNNFGYDNGVGYAVSNDCGIIVTDNPDTMRGADVAFYRDGDEFATMTRRYDRVPPALVAEVVSPHDRYGAIQRRIEQYLARGVRCVWVVDGETLTVSVHRVGQSPQTLDETDTLEAQDLLPGFRLTVLHLFQTPRQRRAQMASDTPTPGPTNP